MKKIVLTSLLTIFSLSAFAQLSVKPNGTSPSFVFVNNQYIFVKQGIALTQNNTNAASEFNASIYLRNGAQLIQGDGPNQLNSGNGSLSVYQSTPGDDKFDYRYWNSPVGNPILADNTPTAAGNANFGALRFFDIDNEVGSNPLTQSKQALVITSRDGIESPMQISRRWLYTQPGGEDNFIRFNDSYGVAPGLGFTMKGLGEMNHSQIYDFRGRPNNGTMTINLVDIDKNQTLSGNPYASAMDIAQMFFDPENLEIMQFEYWDEDRSRPGHNYTDNQGGYGVWLPGAGATSVAELNALPFPENGGEYTAPVFLKYNSDGTPNGATGALGPLKKRRFAPIGQGFMVVRKVGAAGDGTVYIRNSFRKFVKEGAANNSEFWRGVRDADTNLSDAINEQNGDEENGNNNLEEEAISTSAMLRIHTTFGDSYIRDMIISFSNNLTDGYDRGSDGYHPMDATSDVYFPMDENGEMKKLVINGVQFDKNKEYPVNFKIAVQTKIIFGAVEEINMPMKTAYLWDNVTDTYYPITGGRSADFVLDQGDYNGRFFIVFNPERRLEAKDGYNETQEKVLASVDFFQNNKIGELTVSNPEAYTIKNAVIFDMAGKLVYSQNKLGNSTNFSFPTANLADGVYLVKLTTSENINIDYKTLVKNN